MRKAALNLVLLQLVRLLIPPSLFLHKLIPDKSRLLIGCLAVLKTPVEHLFVRLAQFRLLKHILVAHAQKPEAP